MKPFARGNRILVTPDYPNPDPTMRDSGIWMPGRHHLDRTTWDPGLVFTRDDNEVVSGIVVEPPSSWDTPVKMELADAMANGFEFSGDQDIVDARVPSRIPKIGDRVWFARGTWGIAERDKMVMRGGLDGNSKDIGDISVHSVHLVVPSDGSDPWVPGPNVLCRPLPIPVPETTYHQGIFRPAHRTIEKLVYLAGDSPVCEGLKPGLVITSTAMHGRLGRRVPDDFPDSFMDWSLEPAFTVIAINGYVPHDANLRQQWEKVWAYNAEAARYVKPELTEEERWHSDRDERIEHFMDLDVHRKGRKKYFNT